MRRHECDDWESYAAYNKFEAMYGSQEAIKNIKQKFEVEYFAAGLVLAFSTHKRRNLEFSNKNQWLLVGIIRLDESRQSTLDF